MLVLINKILKQKGKGPQQEVFTILPVSVSSLFYYVKCFGLGRYFKNIYTHLAHLYLLWALVL